MVAARLEEVAQIVAQMRALGILHLEDRERGFVLTLGDPPPEPVTDTRRNDQIAQESLEAPPRPRLRKFE